MGKTDSVSHSILGKFRTKLIVLVLLPVLPALALALQRNFDQRRAEKQGILHEITSVSRLIAAKEFAFIKNARQILATLSGLAFLVEQTNQPFCTLNFQNLVKLLPDYLNFGLIESNGTLFAAAVMPSGQAPSLADRSYFRRAAASRKFAAGDFQIGRLTDQPAVNFGFPVFNEAGLHRVLFASLRIDRISDAMREVPLPRGAVATILDQSGVVLGRIPESEQWIGRSFQDTALVRKALRVQDGTFESAGLDGIQRVYAVTPVRDGTAARHFVIVGVPTDLLFAAANQTLTGNLVFMAIVVIAALAVSSFFAERVFVRPINHLAAAADRLAAGDLQTRAPVIHSTTEFRGLSHAFNTMAVRLQERDADLSKARDEIQRINAGLEQMVIDRTAQLTAANQELEAFSYSVSHDLRAPLRHLDGFAELLKRHQRDRLDEKGKRHLEIIGQAARKMGVLIDELLVFSRMGRQEMRRDSVDMDALLRDCIRELEPDLSSRKIEWTLPSLRPVQADAAMLKQVWLNLLSNAIKYTRPREIARIEVGSRQSESEQIFFVRDNGVGFDMKYADKLFGVFQRLHAESEFEGTGIGLANVRRIIFRHGGHTRAESTPDQGSTFYFSIPNDKQPG